MSFRPIMTAVAALALSAGALHAQQQPAPAGQPPAAPAPRPAAPAAPRPAAPAPAAGQPAAAPAVAPAPAAATPPLASLQPDWVKICQKVQKSQTDPNQTKEVCQTVRDLRAEGGQTLAQISVREDKELKKRVLVIAIQPGMQIPPGIRVQVDQQSQQVFAKYSVCLQQVCLAEVADFKDDMLAAFKRGTTVNLQALTIQARGVTFPIQLAGFAKAYDGPPVDPEKLKQEEETRRKELEDAARKAREQLQNGGGAQPAPAPVAPAPAPAPAPGSLPQ